MTTSTLFYFLVASVVLTIAPGPDNIFIMTQGITRGRKQAIITALGMCSGISIHTTAAAFGISAVFSSSIIAFNIVKFVGAAYLLYLAYKTLKERSIFKLSLVDDRPLAELFKRGFIMNVFNPKVALFFLAFLPQFVTPKTSYIPLQMLLLGVVFMLQAVIIFCIIGYFSGSIGSYLQAKPSVAKYFDFLTAGTFVALGIRIAISER